MRHTSRARQQLAGRVLWMAPLAALGVNMGQTVLFATMPMLGRHLGFHEIQITAIISVSALTYFIASPWWGRKSDVFGHRACILAGLGGYAVGTLAFCLIIEIAFQGLITGAALYAVLLLYRIAHTMVMAATHPASSAYIALVTTPAERVKGMSLLAAAISLGALSGPTLVYFARYGFLYPLYLVVGVTAVIFLAVWLRLPSSSRAATDETGKNARTERRVSYFDPRTRGYLLVGATMYCMMAVTQQTLGFYFQDRLGLETFEAMGSFAVALMIAALCTMVAQAFVARRWTGSPATLLLIGIPIAAAGYGLLPFGTAHWQLNLAMGLSGFGMGLCGPGYAATCSLLVEREEQGAIAGLAASMPGLGFVFGPVIGSGLYTLSITWPYLFAALLLAAVSLWLLLGNLPRPATR